MKTTTNSKATEGSFLQHFQPSKPGTKRPKGKATPGGIQVGPMVTVQHTAGWNFLEDMFGGKR